MTKYGDDKCLDCEHNRGCYMQALRCSDYNVEFICKKDKTKDEEIAELKAEVEKLKIENKVLKDQMVAMVQPNYTYGIR